MAAAELRLNAAVLLLLWRAQLFADSWILTWREQNIKNQTVKEVFEFSIVYP